MTSPAAARTAVDGTRVYRGVDLAGAPWELPGWSTTAGVLDKPGLNIWKNKKIAFEVGRDEQLQDIVDKATDERDPILNDAIRSAMDRGTRRRDLGDLVHYWTEKVDLGEATVGQVPDEARGYVQSWENAKTHHGITVVAVEQTVFNNTHRYAGTFDRAIRMAAYRGVVVADVKTGDKVWPDTALQISAYAHGEGIYDAELDVALPMPEGLRLDVGVVIHLAEDGYELVPLDIATAWPAVQAIARCWHWQRDDAPRSIGRPLPVRTFDPMELA